MKLFLICMIRNEIDILPSFLGHVDSLFDSGCLIDHLSSDGSSQLIQDFISSRPGWEYQPLKTPAFVQAEKSSELLNRGFNSGADAVFFLDADEFIREMSRALLEQAIRTLEANKLVGQLCWRNCLPVEYRDTFSLAREAWLCGLSPHKKLAVPRWLHGRYGERLSVNQGNHSLRLPNNESCSMITFGEILHFPIRSRQQFIRKILISYVSQAIRPQKIVAPHIQMLFDTLARCDLTPEMLNALGVNYGSQKAIEGPTTHADLEKCGYMHRIPDVSHNRLDFVMPPCSSHNTIDFGDVLPSVHT